MALRRLDLARRACANRLRPDSLRVVERVEVDVRLRLEKLVRVLPASRLFLHPRFEEEDVVRPSVRRSLATGIPSRIASITAASPLRYDSISFTSFAFASLADANRTSAICVSSVLGRDAFAAARRSSISRDSLATLSDSRSSVSSLDLSAASAAPGKDQYQLLVPILSTCTRESSTRLCTTSFTAWNTTPFLAAAFSMSFSNQGSRLS